MVATDGGAREGKVWRSQPESPRSRDCTTLGRCWERLEVSGGSCWDTPPPSVQSSQAVPWGLSGKAVPWLHPHLPSASTLGPLGHTGPAGGRGGAWREEQVAFYRQLNEARARMGGGGDEPPSPVPPDSPGCSPEVPSQPLQEEELSDLDLQDVEEVQIGRDTCWPGE